jgi:hypothetical protein
LKLEPKLGSKTRSSSKTRTEPRPESGTGTESFGKQMFLRGGEKGLELRVNCQLTCFLIFITVEQLLSEQLSAQDPRGGQQLLSEQLSAQDSRGGLRCFWCPNKT